MGRRGEALGLQGEKGSPRPLCPVGCRMSDDTEVEVMPMLLHPSVQFRHSVMSDSFRPHGPQHTRLPCPLPTPRACSDSCLLSRWCHLTISSSHPLHLLPSTIPSIRVFSSESVLRIRWPNYGNFSFSISPMNIQDWFPLGWTGWISSQSKGLSRVYSSTTVQKHQFFSAQLSL